MIFVVGYILKYIRKCRVYIKDLKQKKKRKKEIVHTVKKIGSSDFEIRRIHVYNNNI